MQLGQLEHRGIKLSWRQKQGRGPLQSRPGEPWELPGSGNRPAGSDPQGHP